MCYNRNRREAEERRGLMCPELLKTGLVWANSLMTCAPVGVQRADDDDSISVCLFGMVSLCLFKQIYKKI